MSPLTPDRDRDIIVEHVTGRSDESVAEDRWVIFLGSAKRGEAASSQNALVFARLLADLMKRPVWLRHGTDDLQPFDTSSARGCSCC